VNDESKTDTDHAPHNPESRAGNIPPFSELIQSEKSHAFASIKLTSSVTRESWEIPVLYEDTHLLVLSKPARLLTSPDRYDRDRPNLMRLLLDGVTEGKPWAKARELSYLANVHRLDFETTGILVLTKDKPSLVALANLFGSEKPIKTYLALVSGIPVEPSFSVDLKLRQDRVRPGRMRWAKDGKRSVTDFEVLEQWAGIALMQCRPLTGRTHQIRVHLQAAGLPIFGDPIYGENRQLFLSQLKRGYRIREGEEERPLTPGLMLHAWRLEITHPATGEQLHIEAPWPQAFTVAVRHLNRYGGGHNRSRQATRNG